jgi:CheY-like chemotaxis protein
MDVLVVDDNEVVADSLAFLLDSYGHRVTVVHDGETALRLLRDGAFELVLFDEHLAGIKGSAVAPPIIDVLVHRPAVVFMTGDSDSYGECAQLFAARLDKPFSVEALMQLVDDVQDNIDASALLAA